MGVFHWYLFCNAEHNGKTQMCSSIGMCVFFLNVYICECVTCVGHCMREWLIACIHRVEYRLFTRWLYECVHLFRLISRIFSHYSVYVDQLINYRKFTECNGKPEWLRNIRCGPVHRLAHLIKITRFQLIELLSRSNSIIIIGFHLLTTYSRSAVVRFNESAPGRMTERAVSRRNPKHLNMRNLTCRTSNGRLI